MEAPPMLGSVIVNFEDDFERSNDSCYWSGQSMTVTFCMRMSFCSFEVRPGNSACGGSTSVGFLGSQTRTSLVFVINGPADFSLISGSPLS
ncbi:hypothetical protein ACH5RR_013458 [Cinchona calisaya]|uniref:Uncharacterized protein n=1 Tax=Cinchona calisaya TaxID=153742 RepID=A0ABD3A2A8_9GENT